MSIDIDMVRKLLLTHPDFMKCEYDGSIWYAWGEGYSKTYVTIFPVEEVVHALYVRAPTGATIFHLDKVLD